MSRAKQLTSEPGHKGMRRLQDPSLLYGHKLSHLNASKDSFSQLHNAEILTRSKV